MRSFFESHFDANAAYFNIKIFYIFVLFNSFQSFAYYESILPHESILPLWPVAWTFGLPAPVGFILTAIFLFFSTILTIYNLSFVWLRIMTFIGLINFIAYINSFGKINHGFHLLVLISFLLIFLPTKLRQNSKNELNKQKLRIVYMGCQAMIMLTYTLSGLWKIESGIFQLISNQVGSFHPLAMSYQIAARSLEVNSKGILGDFLINNYWVSWPLYLGAIYIELFSVYAVFRPSLHKLWGGFLIIFHFFIYLAMTIAFSSNIFLVGLFFLNSPYGSKQTNPINLLNDLPIIGNVIGWYLFLKRKYEYPKR